MENLALLIIGVICIILGISHKKGNISALHSYHTKRVSKEDILPFGKLVGLGTIIIGIALILTGGLFFASDALRQSVLYVVGNVVLIVGLVVGVGICFYAMIKYNKGIF